jgi:uncharacterized membrane protein (DUF485 family)
MVTFKLEEEDYLAAAKLNRRPAGGAQKRSPTRYYLRVTFWLVVILLAVLIFRRDPLATTSDSGLAAGMFIGVGVTLLCLALVGVYARYFGEPRRHKRLYQQYKAMQRTQQLSWSDEGLVLASEQGSTRIDWPELIKWMEGNGLILLYLSDALYLIIPQRCFPDAETHSSFRSAVQAHVPS